jgi:hypothetical protein
MKEYTTEWNPLCVDEVNLRLPEILKGVTLELEPITRKIPTRDGEYLEIQMQPLVKIVVDYSQKEYFVHKLKSTTELDETFPYILQAFIAKNLQLHVY